MAPKDDNRTQFKYYKEDVQKRGKPFFPYAMFHDTVMSFVVVAVIIGYFLGGEALGRRTIVGTACVLVSVLVITTTRKTSSGRETIMQEERAAKAAD